jgi:aminotransferase
VPGDAFGPGGEGFVRCSYATSLERLEAAADRMQRFTARLGAGRPAVAAR